MSQNTIGLGVSNPLERSKRITEKFAVLIAELQKADMNVVLVGASDSNDPTSPMTRLLLDSDNPGAYTQIDHTDHPVGSIRDYTGEFLDQGVPMLNEPAVRAATANKFVLADVLGEDTQPTTLLEKDENLREHLAQGNLWPYLVKPVAGLLARGVEIIETPEQADKVFAEKMVVQPYVDTTQMPDQLVGIGDFYASLVATEGVPKEIRMFSYRHGDGETDMLPLLRVSKVAGILEDDHYVMIQPESVPDEAFELARRTFDKIAAYTGVDYLHGAIDMVWVDGIFKVMEVNTKEQALPKMKNEKEGEDAVGKAARIELGFRTRHLLARQLVRLAVDHQAAIDKIADNMLQYSGKDQLDIQKITD